jgi:hypothetical protein
MRPVVVKTAHIGWLIIAQKVAAETIAAFEIASLVRR